MDLSALSLQLGAGLQSPFIGAAPAFSAGAGAAAGVPTGGELPQGQLLSGTVKAWIDEKGFGFVTPNSGGPDVFVHRNQLADGQTLQQGVQVTFECRFNPARAKYEATVCSGVSAGAGAGVLAAAGSFNSFAGFAGKGGCGSQDNLWVSGFPLDMTEDRIRDIFGQYGNISQCKVLPDQPGKLDRAALVRFSDENQAKWMVDHMNGNIPIGMGTPLTVRFAGDRPMGKGGFGYGKAVVAPPIGVSADSRFAPYSPAPYSQAQYNPALSAGLPAATTTQGVATTTAGTQLSDASLSAALAQLLPTFQQQLQQQAAPAATQMIPGIAAPQAAAVDFSGLAQSVPANSSISGFVGAAPSASSSLHPGHGGFAPAPVGAAVDGLTLAASSSVAPLAAAPMAMAPVATVAPATSVDAVPFAAAPGAQSAAVQSTFQTPAQAPVQSMQGSGTWLEAKDPASGNPYFYHSITRETRWDKPVEMG